MNLEQAIKKAKTVGKKEREEILNKYIKETEARIEKNVKKAAQIKDKEEKRKLRNINRKFVEKIVLAKEFKIKNSIN